MSIICMYFDTKSLFELLVLIQVIWFVFNHISSLSKFHIHVFQILYGLKLINTLRLRQNGWHVADSFCNSFILLNGNYCILIRISLKFVPYDPIDNNSAVVQVMAWHQTDESLSEPMVPWSSLLMQICHTQPQWVKAVYCLSRYVLIRSLCWLRISELIWVLSLMKTSWNCIDVLIHEKHMGTL